MVCVRGVCHKRLLFVFLRMDSGFVELIGSPGVGGASDSDGLLLSVGKVVELHPYGRFTGMSLGVVVRVLALEVDVVALELEGSTEWRRLSRGLVRKMLADYLGEVSLPLGVGGLLWNFRDDFVVEFS